MDFQHPVLCVVEAFSECQLALCRERWTQESGRRTQHCHLGEWFVSIYLLVGILMVLFNFIYLYGELFPKP